MITMPRIPSPTLTVNANYPHDYFVRADTLNYFSTGTFVGNAHFSATTTRPEIERRLESVVDYYSLMSVLTSEPFRDISHIIMNPQGAYMTGQKLDKGLITQYFEDIIAMNSNASDKTRAELKAILVMIKNTDKFNWSEENE